MRYMGTTTVNPGIVAVAAILITAILAAPASANAGDGNSGGLLEADSLVLSRATSGELAPSGMAFTDPPTCPDDGTLVVGQAPELEYWVAAFSDTGDHPEVSLARYDNFIATERITGIRFWGLSLWFNRISQYWVQCTENPMPFDIRFYADDDGEPGDEVCSYWASVPGAVVGSLEGLPFDVYEYVVEFEQPCVLRDGWVSIVGEGADNCWFLWLASYEGDSHSRISVPWYRSHQHFDLSMCLTTDDVPAFGACCDDLTGSCEEDVELSECAGRFIHNGTCAELDPPCDELTGACCYSDGTCATTTFEACMNAVCPGDLDCNGVVDVDDIDRFVEALRGEDRWSYPYCPWRNADCNGDGTVDFDDIDPFVTLLDTDCGQPTGMWLGAGTECDVCPPRPIVLPADLPYDNTNSTCGHGNNHEWSCLFGYNRGEDVVYELIVVDGPVDVEITLNQNYVYSTGLLLDDEYPPGATHLAASAPSTFFPHSLDCVRLDTGTYYVLVDGWSGCIDWFRLEIEECVAPTGRCCYGDPPVCTEVAELTCDQLGGTWDESLDCSTPCPGRDGEDCAHATLIADVPYQATFYTNEMTADGPGGSCDKYAGGPMPNDAWFVWTAPADGLATATVQAEGHETIIVVRDNCDDLTELHCSDGDDYDEGLGETLSFVVSGGQTYYFQIGDPGTHSIGGWTQLDLNLATGVGACCLTDGTCQELNAVACGAEGGEYQGDGTTCAGANCPQPTPGDNCENPIAVTIPGSLNDHNTTTGRGNNYADTCLGSFDSGEDIIYELTVAELCAVSITLDPNGTPHTGVLLANGCPTDADCIAYSTSVYGDPHTIDCVVLVPGMYYVMVDKWLAPAGIPEFDLFIDDGTPPTGACCVDDSCVATNWQAECQMLSGSWFEGESCSDFACPDLQGDTCADPIVINLPADIPFENSPSPPFGDAYNGVTCLESDAGWDVIYQLVVSDTPVCVDITVCFDFSTHSPGMAIAETCPPVDECIFEHTMFESLVLEPGAYYLMMDTGPAHPYWGQHGSHSLTIETCRNAP